MKKLIVLILAFTSLGAIGQVLTLSPEAEVSIITCGPGQSELYTAFGHSAIRVADPVNGLDYAYNYGVFDFDQPNFYLNYTRGLLFYKLGVYPYPRFRDIYVYYNRSVAEQVLALTAAQKQAIYSYLERNALPENETYRYDYFYNNCSNKVRDAFVEALGDSIHFDGSFITTDYTIRQLTNLYLKYQPWGNLGIDICLGLPMDKKATAYEYMYLPDYLASSFDHAFLNRNGVPMPIVKYKNLVYNSHPEEIPKSLIHPWVVTGGLFVATIALSVYDWRRKRLSKWFDLLSFGGMGTMGLLLLVLWTATNHKAAANNFNILWALPTHLFVVVIAREKSAMFLKKYFSGITVLTALLLICWFSLPQQMNVFLLPVVAALLVRAYVISRLL